MLTSSGSTSHPRIFSGLFGRPLGPSDLILSIRIFVALPTFALRAGMMSSCLSWDVIKPIPPNLEQDPENDECGNHGYPLYFQIG